MAGIDNLTPFKPGQSGNPSGKPVGIKNRATILREILALADKDGKTNEYKVIEALCTKAQDGDVPAIKEVQDTMYGKLADKIQEVAPEPVKEDVDDLIDLLTSEQLEAWKVKSLARKSLPEPESDIANEVLEKLSLEQLQELKAKTTTKNSKNKP